MSHPLSVYLHIPFCVSKCNYCSFISFANCDKTIPAYVQALQTEISLRRVECEVVQSVYLGGGTPSLLPVSSISEILNTLRQNYHITDTAEITIEANPDTISLPHLTMLKGIGINRLSIGIQSFNEADLKILGRTHTAHKAISSIEKAKRAGFYNISIDLMYGIPERKPEDWVSIVERALSSGVEHISIYGLTIDLGTKLHEMMMSGSVKSQIDDASADEYEVACAMLSKAGFIQYEISNWAKPNHESRHNTAYWKRHPYIGYGVAAHSFLLSKRFANTSDIDKYIKYLDSGQIPPQSIENIDKNLALSESIILGLRLNCGVATEEILSLYGVDVFNYFSEQIEECLSHGLLERIGNTIRLTSRGRLLSNEVFWRFLPDNK